MIVQSVSIKNLSCFPGPTDIGFSGGVNVVLGKNSSGKSTILKAIALERGIPHESLDSKPSRHAQLGTSSEITLSLMLARDEVQAVLSETAGSSLQIPIPKEWTALGPVTGASDSEKSTSFVRNYFEREIHQVVLSVSIDSNGNCKPSTISTPDVCPYEARQHGAIRFTWPAAGGEANFEAHIDSNTAGWLYWAADSLVFERLRARIFRFEPNRAPNPQSPPGSKILKADGSNLATCLGGLYQNAIRYGRYFADVQYVLPEIQALSFPQHENGTNSIRVWYHDPATERDDLANGLENCGSGTGQVLAILAAVYFADYPQVLLVDEPQTFLHPGALFRLMATLRKHNSHQYILATHSPMLISSSDPGHVLLLEKDQFVATVESIDPRDVQDNIRCIHSLGAHFAEMYGADRILWVEGPTEEFALPYVIQKLMPEVSPTTKICSVRNTGDIDSKKSREWVLDTLAKLSNGPSVSPPVVGVVFDSEARDLSKQKEISNIARDKGLALHFTKRRLFENYLLMPEAIEEVYNADAEKADLQRTTKRAIKSRLKRMSAVAQFFPDGKVEVFESEKWFREVHGAKLLEQLFRDLSKSKLQFSKTRHSVRIAEVMASKHGAHLKELVAEIGTWLG